MSLSYSTNTLPSFDAGWHQIRGGFIGKVLNIILLYLLRRIDDADIVSKLQRSQDSSED